MTGPRRRRKVLPSPHVTSVIASRRRPPHNYPFSHLAAKQSTCRLHPFGRSFGLALPHCIIERMRPSIDRALRAESYPCIAFTGAGGKTTAMFQLARSLPPAGDRHGDIPPGRLAGGPGGPHIVTDSPGPIEELEHGLQGVILVTGPLEGDRTRPVHEDLAAWLHEYCGYHAVPLLIEADGSRQKPLKAWADHEPAVPGFVDQVVQVAGLSALGKPLQEEYVHRVEIFSRYSGLHPGDTITAQAITNVLSHAEGGLKNMPSSAAQSHPVEPGGYGGAAIRGKQNGPTPAGRL